MSGCFVWGSPSNIPYMPCPRQPSRALLRRRRQPVAHAVWQQPAAPPRWPTAVQPFLAAGHRHLPAAAGRGGLHALPSARRWAVNLLPAPRHLTRQHRHRLAARLQRPARSQAGGLWAQRGEAWCGSGGGGEELVCVMAGVRCAIVSTQPWRVKACIASNTHHTPRSSSPPRGPSSRSGTSRALRWGLM